SPAPGVVVSIDGRGVLADATGSFSIANVAVKPNVSQTVAAITQDGLRSGSTSFVLGSASQVVSGLVITLSGLGSAKFTVLDAAGHAVPNQELRAPCADVCGCGGVSTGPDGTATLTNLGLGDYSVRAIRIAGGVTDVASGQASVKRDGDTGFGVLQFAGSGTVTGKVLNPDNTPSFGASVALSSRHFFNDGLTTCDLIMEVSHRVQTGPDGTFAFSGVNVGPVNASASQPFFPTTVGASSTLKADGQTLTFPPLRLVNTIAGVLSGRVFLPDGTTPIGAGVEVTASGPLPDITVSTDDQGQYHFAKILPEGLYRVRASDAVTGGLAQDSIYLSAGQDMTHDLRLKGRGTVSVTVVDGANRPVASAFVRVRETDYPGRTYEGSIDASNQGVATFENVFEGPLSVEASDSLGRGGRTSAVMPRPGGTTISVQVGLTVTGTVKGHFYMPDGATAIPFGVVSLTAGGRTIGQVTTQGVGDVGLFSFSFVPAGPVRLDAQDPLTARTGLAVGSVDSQDQVLTLNVLAQGLGTVTGPVTQNGQPIGSVQVEVQSGAFRATTFTDGSGLYIVKGVPEGHVVVTASFTDGSFSGTAAGTLAGDGSTLTVPVALQGSGQVSGQVLSVDGVTPAPVSLVSIQTGGSAALTTTSNAAGFFSFDRVPTGRASLTASVLGSIDQGVATATVPAGGAVQVPITLNGIGILGGVGVDSAGQPVDGTLKITGTGPIGYFFYLVLSQGSGGTFLLPQVLAGPFTASLTSVSSGGATLYGTVSGTVTAGRTTQVTIALQPTGTITGSILRPDGKTPAYGASVTVDLDQGRGSLTAQAQNDGAFTVNGVPLGAFTLRASDPLTSGLGLVQGKSLD
ncbi:MAG TPA: carboxypeptidase-like regulatory domain-containing protein, partial [Vicinamibacteria bacterium]|nr:carboxypeptidase-like regulatory domain-containing protein [Vicinamibacteria bacterium]